jgi:hypothetical protein
MQAVTGFEIPGRSPGMAQIGSQWQHFTMSPARSVTVLGGSERTIYLYYLYYAVCFRFRQSTYAASGLKSERNLLCKKDLKIPRKNWSVFMGLFFSITAMEARNQRKVETLSEARHSPFWGIDRP